MKFYLIVVAFLFSGMGFSQSYSKVKIILDNNGLEELSELGIPVDHGIHKSGYFFISDFSENEIQRIADNGFDYEILVDDVKSYYAKQNQLPIFQAKNVSCTQNNDVLPAPPVHHFENDSYAGFYKYQDMLNALDSMAILYPNLITTRAPISTFLTHEGRSIYHVKISDNPTTDDPSEPKVLYTSIHHAREPMSMSQTIFYMWYLLENYATNSEVQFLVDNTELYFVPCINPDGYLQNESNDPNGFGMHRKNKAAVGTFNPGVDLNRNYSYLWNTTGVSSNEDSDTYPGTSAFSEPETQAIRWLSEQKGFKTAFNAHSYGNLLLHPIGAEASEFADHHDYFTELTDHMCSMNGYVAQKATSLYPASGNSDDYMYKMDIGLVMKDTVFSMTPEIGTDFWPAQGEVVPTCQEMIFPNMILAHIAHKYLVVKEADPLYVELTSGSFTHNVHRLGIESGVVTVLFTPLLNIQSLGAPIQYDINWNSFASGTVNYALTSGIQTGDEIKYVITTDYGSWAKYDTITKLFGQLVPQVFDDAANSSNWIGSWSTTTDDSYSPVSSFTESDGGDYSNDAFETYRYLDDIDLTNAQSAIVSFYAKWDIESDYDYCQFQVSYDGGNSWVGQCGTYTVEGDDGQWGGGVQPPGEPVWEGSSDWVLEQINLSDYLGQTIRVRFAFGSDGGLTMDGFYFDDFEIATIGGLGIDEQYFQVMAFPNPADEQFVLSTSQLIANDWVCVYDPTGDLVAKKKIVDQTNQVIIDTSGLPSGWYMIKVLNAGKAVKPAKLIVIH